MRARAPRALVLVAAAAIGTGGGAAAAPADPPPPRPPQLHAASGTARVTGAQGSYCARSAPDSQGTVETVCGQYRYPLRIRHRLRTRRRASVTFSATQPLDSARVCNVLVTGKTSERRNHCQAAVADGHGGWRIRVPKAMARLGRLSVSVTFRGEGDRAQGTTSDADYEIGLRLPG